MSTLTDYNVCTAPSSNTYYTIWDTYCTSPQQTSPSYGVTQAKKQRLPGMYPMQWDFNSAKQLVVDLKDNHAKQKLSAKRDRAESAIRRQYSQQLFDHALKDASNKSVCLKRYDVCHTKQLSELERPHTTGPTRYGSPIYNKRADLLNRIRVKTATARLNTDTETRRAGTRTAISETITDSNEIYRLISRRNRKKHFTSLQFVERTADDLDLAESVESEGGHETVDQQDVVESIPSIAIEDQSMVTISIDKPAKSSAKLDQSTIRSLLHGIKPLRPLSAATSRSSGSGYSDVSMVPRGKTWVDFVSVSSLGEENRIDSAKSRNQSDGNRLADNLAQAEPVLPEPPAKQQDAEEVKPEVPAFICPSSEQKSREYAVKLWVVTSNFRQAAKTVPLA